MSVSVEKVNMVGGLTVVFTVWCCPKIKIKLWWRRFTKTCTLLFLTFITMQLSVDHIALCNHFTVGCLTSHHLFNYSTNRRKQNKNTYLKSWIHENTVALHPKLKK